MTIQYSSRSQIAVEKIRNDILTGKLRAGEKINQNRLAKELNISHIPLREALKQLEGEGYIDVVTYDGVYVKELHKEEMEDLYLVRAKVEELAAGLAIDKLSREDIKHLRELFGKMKKATQELRYNQLLALNREFHYTIYQACRRKYLLEILDDLWNRSSRYRQIGILHPQRAEEALREHEEMLNACAAGDKAALMRAVRTNVENTRRYLARQSAEL